jgi:hypothetical protein
MKPQHNQHDKRLLDQTITILHTHSGRKQEKNYKEHTDETHDTADIENTISSTNEKAQTQPN